MGICSSNKERKSKSILTCSSSDNSTIQPLPEMKQVKRKELNKNPYNDNIEHKRIKYIQQIYMKEHFKFNK